MTDDELFDALERGELDPATFHHDDHVRVAWIAASRCSLSEAIARTTGALARLAAKAGVPERYHETITIAYLLLVHDRVHARPSATWAEFSADNPDLLDWNNSILSRYYRDETLRSDRARQSFVFPDRIT